MVSATVLFTYLQFHSHLAVLGLAFYASGLLPFALSASGCLFFSQADRLSNQWFILLSGCSAAVLAFVWADYNEKWLPYWPDHLWPAAILGAVLFAGALFMRRHPVATTALALAGFACLTSEVRRMRLEHPMPFTGPHAYRNTLQRVMNASSHIDAVRQNHPLRFWFDPDEPPSDDYSSINAVYLERYSRLEPVFGPLSCAPSIKAGTVVVASSIAGHARAALSHCMSIHGLHFARVTEFVTASPAGNYTTAILTTEMDAARWHTLQLPSNPSTSAPRLSAYTKPAATLHSNLWTTLYPDLGSHIEPVREGLLVRTGTKPLTDAASFGPIVIPASGRYGFSLGVTRHAGEFVFGVVSDSETNWIAATPSGDPGSVTDLECWLDLQQGQRIWLRIANGKTANSEFIIRGIQAVEIDPAP
jgi:hypothetical protein